MANFTGEEIVFDGPFSGTIVVPVGFQILTGLSFNQPSIVDVSPVPAELGPTDPLAFTINGADTRTLVVIRFPGLRFTELVYDGVEFTERYAAGSSFQILSGTARRYFVRRAPIWPDAPEVTVYAYSGLEL